MVLRRFRNPPMAVRFCHRAPNNISVAQLGRAVSSKLKGWPFDSVRGCQISGLISMDRMPCFELGDVGSIPAGPAIKCLTQVEFYTIIITY